MSSSQLITLWRHLSKRRQKQFYLLFFLMLLSSVTEVISIGSVLPFLGILTAPEQVFYHPIMQDLIKILEIKFGSPLLTEPTQLILPITVAFIVAAVLAGIIRLALLYVLTRLSHATGADLSIEVYNRTLYQDYSVHTARNSSEVINSIIIKTGAAVGIIQSVLTLISSIIILVGIISALVMIDITVAMTAISSFGFLYWLVIHFTKTQLKENSQIIAENSTLMVKSLQEGLGGIRDVLIDSTQQFYCNIYRKADLPLRRAHANNSFIGTSPRYVMEAIGMTLIAGIAYAMTQQQGGMATAIPVLGALALGAQRLLPSLQQSYAAISSIKGAKSSFQDVLNMLAQPLPKYVDRPLPSPIKFEEEIQLNNISFRYTEDEPWVLKDISFKIAKGERIGFMGVTGSGKSTLLDIVMGLLTPTKGLFTVDREEITRENRRAWQAHIAHVPQTIYLSDNSIEENIAFGIQKDAINHQQIKNAAEQAQIAELIEGWKNGYQTFIGERGIRLSGGQRQRIGIARALYKKANVLIFDEATSALDDETEQSVMQAIEGLGRDITILIIAHRLTTLKGCDQIITLADNGVKIRKYSGLN